MHLASLLQPTGYLLVFMGLAQGFPLAWAFYLGSPDRTAFVLSMTLTLAVGFALRRWFPRPLDLGIREAVITVVCGWLVAGLAGSLPFVLSGVVPHWTDAWFESVSGLTTTGATVLEKLEDQPAGILMWRAMLQWLGGMGIIVLFIAVFPKLGVGGTQLLAAEVTGPVVEKLTPRIRHTASLLWKIYLALTGALMLLLLLCGLPLYDAILHVLSTISTGGFSNRTWSVGSFQNAVAEWVLALFSFLGGVNFALLYRVLWLREFRHLRNSELLAYIALIIVASALVAASLWSSGSTGQWGEALRQAIFHVISILTTTGFATANYDAWPPLARTVLFTLLFVGAMAGSTSGGPKIFRFLVLFKDLLRGFRQMVHPHSTVSLTIDGHPVGERVASGVAQFFFAYGLLFFVSVIVLSVEGYDLVTTATAVLGALGNVGPGLGLVGPYENYAFFSPWAKQYLTFLMIAGRLEVITVLALLTPDLWRR